MSSPPTHPPVRARNLRAVVLRSVVSALVIYAVAIVVFALFHGGLHLDYVVSLARENPSLGLVLLALLLVRNLWLRRRA